jgi:hypothetical protein
VLSIGNEGVYGDGENNAQTEKGNPNGVRGISGLRVDGRSRRWMCVWHGIMVRQRLLAKAHRGLAESRDAEICAPRKRKCGGFLKGSIGQMHAD